jgi:large subunit ribosomal protein L6
MERVTTSPSLISLPSFLLPAFPLSSSRSFSASAQRPSHIGRAPLSIPPEVTFTVHNPIPKKNIKALDASADPIVEIEGPKGTVFKYGRFELA